MAYEPLLVTGNHGNIAPDAVPLPYRLNSKSKDETTIRILITTLMISQVVHFFLTSFLNIRNSGVYVIVDCQPGTHQYKYYIDGAWYHDPTKPTVDNEYGTKNNVVCVNESDFDVLHALEQDQACSRKRSDSSDSTEVSHTVIIIFFKYKCHYCY
ncbi:unnamed protein product [Trichobilharzia regenti]|nr:unnamed protein product [Trichobilharzia regenti]